MSIDFILPNKPVIAGFAADLRLGKAVATSADGIIVAAATGTQARIIVYNYENNVWNERGTLRGHLDPANEEIQYSDDDCFAMSSDGNTIAGVFYSKSADSTTQRFLRVFRYNTSTNIYETSPTQTSLLLQTDNENPLSIAMNSNGTRFFVGDPTFKNHFGNEVLGRVLIFHLNFDSTWVLIQTITGPVNGGQFGASVECNTTGTQCMVGSPGVNNNTGRVDEILLTDANLSDNPQYNIILVAEGESEGDHFGEKLAFNSEKIAITAPGADQRNGYVKVYKFDNATFGYVPDGTKIESFAPAIGGEEAKSSATQFNMSITLHPNSKLLAIGTAGYDSQTAQGGGTLFQDDVGRVRILELQNNNWQLLSEMVSTEDFSGFGSSIEFSTEGNTLVMGAEFANATDGTGNFNVGRVSISDYVYTPYVAPGSTPPVPEAGGHVPCFPIGTRILTTTGYKAVEKLDNNDRVVTADGRNVSFRLYKTEIEKTNEKNAPFVIPARTFGASPKTDLTLSPMHAFQIRPNVWQIPKYAATTHPAIEQIYIGKPITYYHIETPNYFKDNLVVEGTIAESYAANQVSRNSTIYHYSHYIGGFIRRNLNNKSITK